MPIECNRVKKECPKCKNPTIFNTGKNYFCGACVSDLTYEEIHGNSKSETEVQDVTPDSQEPIINETEKSESEINIKEKMQKDEKESEID